MSLKECIVIGGVDIQQQTRELARRPHVVIATPGRLKVRVSGRETRNSPPEETRTKLLKSYCRLL
jgi:superfamily II DNA/RNA helicase